MAVFCFGLKLSFLVGSCWNDIPFPGQLGLVSKLSFADRALAVSGFEDGDGRGVLTLRDGTADSQGDGRGGNRVLYGCVIYIGEL